MPSSRGSADAPLRIAILTRGLVVASTLLALVVGLWLLQARPALVWSLGGIVVAVSVGARLRPAVPMAVVLAFAYVSYGVARSVGGLEVAGMPFFLAGFTGLVLGTVPWTKWEARSAWRVPLGWWALGVAITWPIVAVRELDYSLGPSLAAGPIVTTALLQMSLALFMDHLLAEAPRAVPVAPIVASALATGVAAIYQQYVDLSWMSGEPWIRLGRAVGLMGDANPMGVATALWAPLGWVAIASSPVTAVIGGAMAAVLWLAAWASGARTTLILIAAGIVALALTGPRALGWSKRTLLLPAVAFLALTLAATAFLAPRVDPAAPIARLWRWSQPRVSPGATLYEWLWRRDGYGAAAAEAIKEHPLIGVGIGRFTGLSTQYHQRLGEPAIPPDNAQNLWRHTWAEQGILGLLPVLWLTGLTLISTVRPIRSRIELPLRVMLAGIGLSLTVGYPVQDAAIAVTVALLVCAVARGDRQPLLTARIQGSVLGPAR